MNIGLEPYEWPPALQQRIAWTPRSEGARRRLLAYIERRLRFRGFAGIRLSPGIDPFACSTRPFSGLLPLELVLARPNWANSAPAFIRVELLFSHEFAATVPRNELWNRHFESPRRFAPPLLRQGGEIPQPIQNRHRSLQPMPFWPENRLSSRYPTQAESWTRTLPSKAPEPVLASRAAFQTGTASSAIPNLPPTGGWVRRALGKSANLSPRLTRAVTPHGQGLPDHGPSGGLRRVESPLFKSTFEVGAPNPPYAGRTFHAKTSIAVAAPIPEPPRPMAGGVREPALVLKKREPAGAQVSPTSRGGVPDQRALAGSSLVDALFDRALRQQAVPGIDLRLAPPASALGPARTGPESEAAAGGHRLTSPDETGARPVGLSRGEINRVADEVARVLKRRERLEHERRGAY